MQVVFSPGAEIKFEGANNFRELGGYRAADGRQVKYGLLYRGGNLDLLKSEADHARLASLGLREILDLRSAGESAAHPDPAVPGAHYQRVCGMRNVDGTEMDFSGQGIERLRQEKEAFERSVGRPVHDFEWFSALYREMPFRNPAYHALFALLEGRHVPVLFHCSCGKDRTGIGAMLILLALGASDETICADYARTNLCRAAEIEKAMADHAAEIAADPAQKLRWQSSAGVDPEIAPFVLRTIRQDYGSAESYLEAEYGLTPARLMRLRRMYLE